MPVLSEGGRDGRRAENNAVEFEEPGRSGGREQRGEETGALCASVVGDDRGVKGRTMINRYFDFLVVRGRGLGREWLRYNGKEI